MISDATGTSSNTDDVTTKMMKGVNQFPPNTLIIEVRSFLVLRKIQTCNSLHICLKL